MGYEFVNAGLYGCLCRGWLLIVLLLYVDAPIETCLFIVICDGFALVIGLVVVLYVACVVLVCCVFVLFAYVMGIAPLVGLDSVLLLVSAYVVCLIGGSFGLSCVVRLCCLANWLCFGL